MGAMRILIVDDEGELVSTLVERLEIRGIEAIGVTSGAEALELLRKDKFDVVLADVKMPGIDGLKIIRHIKRDLPGLEVVLLTGHGSAQSVEEGMRLGAFDYLTKPFSLDKLIPILRKAAGRRKGDG